MLQAESPPSPSRRSRDDLDGATMNDKAPNSPAAEIISSSQPEDTFHDDDKVLKSKHAADVLSLTDQTNLLPFKKILAVFLGLALCILVSCLDATIVATALPTISEHFNAGSVSSWVPSSYLLTSTAFQPLCKYIPTLS